MKIDRLQWERDQYKEALEQIGHSFDKKEWVQSSWTLATIALSVLKKVETE